MLLKHDVLYTYLTIFAEGCHKWQPPCVILLMKKGKRHIFYAFTLLICFAAGQWAIYGHQHKTFPGLTKAPAHGQVLTEKCQLCDAMHHNSMVQHTTAVFTPVVVTTHFYKQGDYDFVSIALILSAGRSPPLS